MKRIWNFIVLFAILIIPMANVKAADGYFNAGENIVDSQNYNHSVFVAGSNVTSNSKVDGLSFIAGGSVKVSGTKSYVFSAGEDISISSTIENDLFAAGNIVRVEREAYVARDMYLAGNMVTIASNSNGNIFVAASTLNLDDITINGDLHVSAGILNISNTTIINGNLIIDEDTEINGEDNLTYNEKYTYNNENNYNFESKLSDEILDMLSMIFLGIILAIIFPKLFKKLQYKLDDTKDIIAKSLKGFAFLILVPFVIVIAFFLIIGIPLAVILLACYLIALLLSTILTSFVVGYNINKQFLKRENNYYLSIMIGILVIKLIELIPVIGPLVAFVSLIYGIGIIYQLFSERNK